MFLGLQFRSKLYDRSDLVSAVQGAVEMAEVDLQKRYPGIRVSLKHEETKLGEPLNKKIVEQVRNASAAIFEVSDANPNVYFEMGLAYSSGWLKPVILYNKRAQGKIAVASDVRDLLRLQYTSGNLKDRDGHIAKHIKEQIRKREEARTDFLLYPEGD